MIAEAFSAIADLLIGWAPKRQPWQALVVGLYVLAAVAATALLIWLVVTTWRDLPRAAALGSDA